MRSIFQNIRLVLNDKKYLTLALVTFLIFLIVWFMFFEYEQSLGNLGKTITYLEINLHILLSGLFGLFLAGQVYKIKNMWINDTQGKTQGFLGGVFGIIITGCPSCSIGIASYLGLSGILSFLPRYGLELKIIAVLLLLWTNYSMYKNLLVCKRKNIDKSN